MIMYRYEETHFAPPADEMGDPGRGAGTTEVIRHAYPVIRETPRGWWLDLGHRRRFVLRGAHRRFACTTDAAARASFFARKDKQIEILRAQIRCAQRAIRALETLPAESASGADARPERAS